MQYSIVNFKNIKNHKELRIEAEYYSPVFLYFNDLLHKKHTEAFGCLAKEIKCGPFGSTVLCDDYDTSGIIIARPFNIKDCTLENSNLAYMSKADCENKGLKLYTKEDIFFSRVGDIRCGIVPEFKNGITISPNIIAARIDKRKINPYYATIFFNTKYGFLQLLRNTKVVAQPTIQTDTIYDLRVVILDKEFQLLIEKIFKSYFIKRQTATLLYTTAQDLLLKELNLSGWKPKQQLSYIKNYSEAQSSGRLDAEYFHPKYDDILNAIKNYPNGWDVIENKFKQNKKLVKIVSNYSYNYVEIGSVNVETGEIYPQYMPADDLPANAKILLQKDDIIISKVRTYRGAIALVSKTDYIGSAAFTVLHETSDINKETLFVFLKLKPILNLTLKYNSGTSYPTIFDNDILNLPIPNFEQPIQAEIKDKIQSMYQMKEQSKQLLAIAQKGVEMAIEQNEQTATAWINQQLKQLGVEL